MATIESIKAKIQGLIEKANAATSRADTQLTPAVDALIAGYGSGGGGGYIDVTELPKPWKLYFADNGEIQDGEELVKKFFSGIASVEFFYVDEFPVPMAISGNGKSVLYVLKTDGVVYFSNDGITPIRFDDPSNLPIAVCHGLVDSVDDIDANVKGFYTQKGGEIKDAPYRLLEEKEASLTLWVAAYTEGTEISMPFEDFLKMTGIEGNITYTVVETLPDVMEMVNEDTFTFPCYILESTGIAYISFDGTSATAMPFGEGMFGTPGADKGWIDSVDDIVIDTSADDVSIYTIRPGTQLVPKGVYAYSDGWYELEKTLETTEKPHDPRVYCTTKNGEVVDWLQQFEAQGGAKIPFVDALPLDIDGIYVLNANGFVYYVQDGQAVEFTEILSGTNCGWVDSLEEIDTSKPDCLYALRGSKTDVIYKVGENGTTNEVYIHENDEWQGFTKGGSGGGAELNIAYGDTAPEDTSKLWVKTSEPSGVVVSPNDVEQILVEGESCVELDEVMPYALGYAGCGAVGSKIYILGGRNSDGGGINAVVCFDTKTKTFTTYTGVLGTALCGVRGATVGTKIYLIGGGSSIMSTSKLIRCFDTETMTITTCAAELSTALYGVHCGVFGRDVYVFGGRTSSYSHQTTVYKYDTVTDSITTVGALSKAEAMGASAIVGTTFYIFGGTNSARTVKWFDTATLAAGHQEIDFEFTDGAAANFGDAYVYLIGSRGGAPSIYRFDTTTKTAEKIATEAPKISRCSASAKVGNKMFMFGGYDSTESSPPASTASDSVLTFMLDAYAPLVETGLLYVTSHTDVNLWSILKTDSMNVEIGIDSVYKGNDEGIGEEVEAALYKNNTWTNI